MIISALTTLSITLGAVQAQDLEGLITPGDARIAVPVPAVGTARWRLETISDGDTAALGYFERTIESVTHRPDEPSLLTRWHVNLTNRSALDIYYSDPVTLAQTTRYQTSSNGMWVMYTSGSRVHGTLTRTDGPVFTFDVEPPGSLFNGAMVDLVLAALPLRTGSTFSIPIVSGNPDSMEEGVSGRLRFTVEETESIEAGGETYQTWRVRQTRADGNTQLLFVSQTHPFLIRRDILGAGGEVRARWVLLASN